MTAALPLRRHFHLKSLAARAGHRAAGFSGVRRLAGGHQLVAVRHPVRGADHGRGTAEPPAAVRLDDQRTRGDDHDTPAQAAGCTEAASRRQVRPALDQVRDRDRRRLRQDQAQRRRTRCIRWPSGIGGLGAPQLLHRLARPDPPDAPIIDIRLPPGRRQRRRAACRRRGSPGHRRSRGRCARSCR